MTGSLMFVRARNHAGTVVHVLAPKRSDHAWWCVETSCGNTLVGHGTPGTKPQVSRVWERLGSVPCRTCFAKHRLEATPSQQPELTSRIGPVRAQRWTVTSQADVGSVLRGFASSGIYLEVACRRCGVEPGCYCRSERSAHVAWHMERRRAAADLARVILAVAEQGEQLRDWDEDAASQSETGDLPALDSGVGGVPADPEHLGYLWDGKGGSATDVVEIHPGSVADGDQEVKP